MAELYNRKKNTKNQSYTNRSGEQVSQVVTTSDVIVAGRLKEVYTSAKALTYKFEGEEDPDLGVPIEGPVVGFYDNQLQANKTRAENMKASAGATILVKAQKQIVDGEGTVKYFGSKAIYPGGKPIEYKDSLNGIGCYALLGYVVPNTETSLSMCINDWDKQNKSQYQYWITINCPNGVPQELLPGDGAKSVLTAIIVSHDKYMITMNGSKIESVTAELGKFMVIPKKENAA